MEVRGNAIIFGKGFRWFGWGLVFRIRGRAFRLFMLIVSFFE